MLLNKDLLFFCTTVSPVTEEIFKAVPIIAYAFLFSDKRKDLVQISFALGLGFAIMENMNLLAQSIDTVTVLWAVARCFGAGLMHSLCTTVVGLGISYVKKKKKLFVTGTLALVMAAITYLSQILVGLPVTWIVCNKRSFLFNRITEELAISQIRVLLSFRI